MQFYIISGYCITRSCYNAIYTVVENTLQKSLLILCPFCGLWRFSSFTSIADVYCYPFSQIAIAITRRKNRYILIKSPEVLETVHDIYLNFWVLIWWVFFYFMKDILHLVLFYFFIAKSITFLYYLIKEMYCFITD